MIYPYLVVLVIALVTIALRALPFLIFRGKETPKIITYFGGVLPPAVMGMLVVYCLRNTRLSDMHSLLPAACSCIVVLGLHKWKRNTLLSIVAGTVCYMLLIRL